ncbi:YDG/SRA domain-containing protein [Kitasatospora sp. NPDC088134]|uniref:YDG/SRA domain-containing protein n=1 Tax=Kitasatospora sp. NPDC088134 TaxID=3364071 RepID=UPI00380E8CD8
MAKVFGHISGYPVGTWFVNRAALRKAGLHAPLVGGISGQGDEGADSIVISGGYSTDEDFGDVILYTGHGGNENGRQVGDQDITAHGNAGLVRSELEGHLVRVIRGSGNESPYAPDTGFRYDGLFRVDSHRSIYVNGFLTWQFRLVAVDTLQGSDDDRTPEEEYVTPFHGEEVHPPVPRQSSQIQRSVRKSAVKQRVKQWHRGQCQMCHQLLSVPGGLSYSEGAHILAIGQPYNGPDIVENVLCLCPNCHVLFDYGARYLTDDLRVVDGLAHEQIGELRTVRQHRIDVRFVQAHRRRWVPGS